MTEPAAITRMHDLDTDAWRNAWCRDAKATAFDGPDWAHAWRAFSDGRFQPAAQAFDFTDGVRLIVPMSRQRFPDTPGAPGEIEHAAINPGGTFGGLINPPTASTASATAAHREAALHASGERFASLTWCLSPHSFDRSDSRAVDEIDADRRIDGATVRHDATRVIDLAACRAEPGRLDDGMRKAQIARKVRIANRQGLTVELGADQRRDTDELIDAFYIIYQRCQQRWGHTGTHYPRELFASVARHTRCPIHIVRDHGGRPVAAGLFPHASRIVTSWLFIAEPDALSLKPYELGYDAILRHAIEQGFDRFDFNPSGGHDGVDRFKAGFGAVALDYTILDRQSAAVRAAKQRDRQHRESTRRAA